MKQTIAILKSYFETGDTPTQQQFSDVFDSLVHKDEGKIITSITQILGGDIVFNFSDTTSMTIPMNQHPDAHSIDFITGLRAALDGLQNQIGAIGPVGEVNTINSQTASEPSGSDTVSNVVSLTQAEYDAGTPLASTLYIITD
ncbi:hypothetical protein GTQ40_08175 [Flavobacteriaceae bacterium R38]|nr:hypothetical protein [Flavobacteriaceae bacterium R38]